MINWLRENKQSIARALGSLLAFALLLFLLKEESSAEIISAMKSISAGYFLAAIVSMLISRIFVAWRWHALLRAAGLDISFRRTSELTFMGLFASNFLPTTVGGDVARLTGVMQMGYDRAISLASLIADRLIGMAGMTLALPFGIIPVFSLGKDGLQAAVLVSFYHKGIDFTKRTFETFKIWWNKPMALALSFIATLGNMAFIFLSIYFLVTGMNRHISYGLIAGLWSLTYFVTLIPVSINGFGVQELSLTFLLSNLGGLDHSESLTIAVLIRLLFIVTSFPGALFLPSVLAAMNQSKEKK